ncbi:MAG: tRNA dihydrouridine synthase DusB [Polyangiaceae bacterium]|nr:tRNA dihydrouridine synthase DusB [Polyangiaceae bacterium]
MPLTIGSIQLDDHAWLAPMAAVSNAPFRELCLAQGCGLAVTEMVSSEGLLREPWKINKRMTRARGERVLVVQLFGSDPEVMARAGAVAIEKAGADILDVNMGCPVRKVLGAGAGAALMRDPDRAAAIVRALVRTAGERVPVTVKMRAGWNDEVNAVQLAVRVQDAGAAAIVVHGRTREQFHSGPACWSVIGDVKRAVRVPVIGNGGVRKVSDATALREQSGCDAVMVGRGAMGNPWIFRSLALGHDIAPSLEQRFEGIRAHVQRYAEWFGERDTAREMRKHLIWYVRGMPGSAMVRKRMSTLHTLADVIEVLDTYEAALRHGDAAAYPDDLQDRDL